MKFKIDCEHIFFDKYKLSEQEKKASAKFITEKVLREIKGENVTLSEDMVFHVEDHEIEAAMEIVKTIKVLKEEFFLITTEEQENNPLTIRVDAEDYIYKNYQYEHLTPKYVCDTIGLKRVNTEKEFWKKHRMTLTEFIKYVRVEKAKEMLKEGFSNEKCAQCCGFGSVKTMQRAFKTVISKTPGEYRKGVNLDSINRK